MAPRVLIADDTEDMRVLLEVVFAGAGYEVAGLAADGIEAWERWRSLTAAGALDVVVLDNRMPGLTGIEVAERILTETPEQRVVIFSAFLDDDTRARAAQVGVSLCVSKDEAVGLPRLLAT